MRRNQRGVGRMAVLCSAIVILSVAAHRIATTKPAKRGQQIVAGQNKPLAARSAATVIRVKAPNRLAAQIVASAKKQAGTSYDPAYVKLAYPGGDVPADRGVCTDVVVRALRRTNHDLQR